ncbi:MAG: hypothetical protein H8E31_01895 [Planctomycetes bacterium]|nr:hypothetical protein [Planctomycetota bacterium]
MRALEWILRLAVAGEFLGHGVLALRGEPGFRALITGTLDLSDDFARRALVVIGAVDLGIAALALLKPWRPAILYAAFWGLVTAAARPLSGTTEVWEFFQRFPDWAAPLALWLVLAKRARPTWR